MRAIQATTIERNDPGPWRGVRRLVAVGVLLLGPQVALGQATWLVESLIPETLSIRVPSTTITFGVDDAAYPPESFPATYSATEPEGGTLPVQVFSNADGVWNLMLEVPDLLSDVGAGALPASQVLYRVNGGVWVRADGGPQVIYSHVGPTIGWLELTIDFALELTGAETAGTYVVNAVVSAIREPGDRKSVV